MPTFTPDQLRDSATTVFEAAGARPDDARIVGDALVEANLAGHDSHGVMRIPNYVAWMEKGAINVNAEFKVVTETEAFAVTDGDWGFGQVMARKAMEVGIEKAAKVGIANICARNCAHIGRVGDYPIQAAERGMASALFVNTHGAGRLVAPFGGIERRLSANPIAVGVPRPGGDHIIVDISTCVMAEGKLRNFRTAGEPVPEGAILDAEGHATTDANQFYGPPEGAILPIAAHKGFALGLAADILAGPCRAVAVRGPVSPGWATPFSQRSSTSSASAEGTSSTKRSATWSSTSRAASSPRGSTRSWLRVSPSCAPRPSVRRKVFLFTRTLGRRSWMWLSRTG